MPNRPKRTNRKTDPTKAAGKKLTRRERRRLERDEYREALKEFTSFHPDNETREYLTARERLDKADRRRAAWWR